MTITLKDALYLLVGLSLGLPLIHSLEYIFPAEHPKHVLFSESTTAPTELEVLPERTVDPSKAVYVCPKCDLRKPPQRYAGRIPNETKEKPFFVAGLVGTDVRPATHPGAAAPPGVTIEGLDGLCVRTEGCHP